MILDLSDLPSDPEQLKGKLIELASAAEEAAAQRDAALAENEPSACRASPMELENRTRGSCARPANGSLNHLSGSPIADTILLLAFAPYR